MAASFGATTFLDSNDYESQPGREWKMVEVDCSLSTIAHTGPVARQLVPIYDNEGIDVLGIDTVTAGSSSATISVGVYNASEVAIDANAFIDVLDAAAGTFTPAPGGTTPSGSTAARYVNRTGATVYLTIESGTADDAAGKYRIHYKKFPVLEV